MGFQRDLDSGWRRFRAQGRSQAGRVPDLPEGRGPDLPGLEGEARLHWRVLRPGCKLRLAEEVVVLTVLAIFGICQKQFSQPCPRQDATRVSCYMLTLTLRPNE